MQEKIRHLLLWSQKYTRTDMLYLARGGFWVLLGQSLNSILSLILIVAFANLLPKETFGTYRYILSLAGILGVFTLSGMNAAVSRTVARGEEGVLNRAVTYQLVWNLLMVAAFCLLGGYFLFKDNTELAISFLILGIFVPATQAFNTYGAYLEGKKEFKVANVLSVISTLIYSIGMLISLYLTDAVTWLILVYAATTFLPSILFYLYVTRRYRPSTENDALDTLQYGRELSYLKLIDPMVSQIDKVVLAHFWGPAQLATYAFAGAIPNRAILLMKSWVTIGFPKFAEKTPVMLNQVFWRRIIQGMGIGTCVSLLYIFIAPYLFTYLLPQYLDGILYSQILSLNFIFALPNRYLNLLFASQRMSKILFKRTLIQNALLIFLYVVLGIQGGLFGLILANVFNNLLGLLLNISLWKKVSS